MKRPSSWRQALLFNSLLLLLPVMASQVISNAYNADVASDPMSVEARAETRQQIDDAFRSLSGLSGQERVTWAQRIDRTLLERDFSAARGYLLAAPLMLDKDDAAAILAAADAEETGTRDQRLARAALLFLPDETRVAYQRAIAPPELPQSDPLETPQSPPADTPSIQANEAAISPEATDDELSEAVAT